LLHSGYRPRRSKHRGDRRIAIQGGGCSGFEYALGFDTGVHEGDEALEYHGVTVVVDPLSAPYIKGSTIDFVDTLQESGFKIENPNAGASCGCGHSFQPAEGEEPAQHEHAHGGGCGSGGCGCSH
jgi:iron-sulfur cluster assembly accessory protein